MHRLSSETISSLLDLQALEDCASLSTLTLEGNPVTEEPNYRMHVINLQNNTRRAKTCWKSYCERRRHASGDGAIRQVDMNIGESDTETSITLRSAIEIHRDYNED
ncbi:MAG: hypothetical protein EZS28_039902 [Streblomastix strix]|uniref:U2A'/phosphoprotein 32 family A C-terminal domain-containing protein n=1 Tax=Streblomastix strix TaxID=222440 RepID=A0A5J4U3R9_9EUKA|nr:MAG: hypothetical protein EZS28_039902 [Streblomastix strix]